MALGLSANARNQTRCKFRSVNAKSVASFTASEPAPRLRSASSPIRMMSSAVRWIACRPTSCKIPIRRGAREVAYREYDAIGHGCDRSQTRPCGSARATGEYGALKCTVSGELIHSNNAAESALRNSVKAIVSPLIIRSSQPIPRVAAHPTSNSRSLKGREEIA